MNKIILIDDLAVVILKVGVLMQMGLNLFMSKLTRDEDMRQEFEMQEFGLRMLLDDPTLLPPEQFLMYRGFAVGILIGIALGFGDVLAG